MENVCIDKTLLFVHDDDDNDSLNDGDDEADGVGSLNYISLTVYFSNVQLLSAVIGKK